MMNDTMNSMTSTSPLCFKILEPSGSTAGEDGKPGGGGWDVTPNDAYRPRRREREGSNPCIVLAEILVLQSRIAHLTPNNVSDARLMVVYRRSKEIRWK